MSRPLDVTASLPSSASRRRWLAAAAALAGQSLLPRLAWGAEPFYPELGRSGKDVMWLPTPDRMINLLLRIAQASPQDRLVDLGSGDGRLVIAAARDFKTPSLGVEYDPHMVAFSKRRATEAGVQEAARFQQGDIFQTDFSDATIVFTYLLPQLNLRLRHVILAMRPGTRVIAHQFHHGNWRADAVIHAENREGFFWVVPANAGGTWQLTLPDGSTLPDRLDLQQTFQMLEGTAYRGQQQGRILFARMQGYDLTFTLTVEGGQRVPFAATLDGDRMTGRFDSPQGWQPFTAQRLGAAPPIVGAAPASEAELAEAAASLERGI